MHFVLELLNDVLKEKLAILGNLGERIALFWWACQNSKRSFSHVLSEVLYNGVNLFLLVCVKTSTVFIPLNFHFLLQALSLFMEHFRWLSDHFCNGRSFNFLRSGHIASYACRLN